MGTVAVLGRDANTFDENPLKTMSEQVRYCSPYPAPIAHFYMFPQTIKMGRNPAEILN